MDLSYKTIEKIKQFSDPRIKLIVSKQNKSVCETLNNSINKSKGKYIAYVSFDDVWELDKIEKQVKFLNENSEIAAVFTKVTNIDENGDDFSDKNHYYNSVQRNRSNAEWLNHFFYHDNSLFNSSVLIRKSVYDAVGHYNTAMENIYDFDMWIRVCLKHNIHIINEKLTISRLMNNDNNTSDILENRIRFKFEFKQVLNHYLKINDVEFFKKIFPESEKYGKLCKEMIPYFLGRIAYDTFIDFKQLWGLEIIYQQLQSHEIINILRRDFDFTYSDFLDMSSKTDIDYPTNLIETLERQDQEKQIKINTQKNQLILKNEIIHEKDDQINDMQKQEIGIRSQIEELRTVFYEMNYLSNHQRSLTQRLISKFPSLYIILKDKGLKKSIITIKGYRSIKKNHLFDVGYYLKKYEDIRQSGVDPLLNYIFHGYKEGRKPNPTFDANYYLNTYEDVQNSGINPLIHYSLYGIKENRITSRNLNYKKQKVSIIKDQQIIEKKPGYWKKKHAEILKKNASLIDLYPFKEDSPMVSIIILNRNGLNHLKRLFKNFKENVQYPSYEIIVADNASDDESVQFLESLREKLPLKIIKNTENNTFSRVNNEAVNLAKGEYILLLNNDIEPAYGWLNEMMQITLKYKNIGAIGAKLVHPDCSMSIKNRNNSYKIQHTGIAFKKLPDGSIKPYNIGKGLEPFDSHSNSEETRAGVTAAVLLVEKKLYQEVGGLDEEYNYGYEDVDFCLKLLKKGYDNIYCPKALLYHYEHGTDEANDQEYRLERFRAS